MVKRSQWVEIGWVEKIPRNLRNFTEWAAQRRREYARNALPEFLDELKDRQPIGEDDPYVDAFPLWRTERRPSVRQGLVPIEQGWSGQVVDTNRGARIEISSSSEHLQYFTRWTGRDWLGTRKGTQVAQNARTLAFWWRGQGWWPKSARGGGFRPQSDFVQDAYNSTLESWKRVSSQEAREAMLYILE